MTKLKTERLTLRRPAAHDWPQARDFFMSDRAGGVGGARDLGQSWRHFAAQVGQWDINGFGMWTVTKQHDSKALGMVGPWCPADWPENEIGWLIFDPAVEGTGIAHEAANAVLNHAFTTLKWETAVSYITQDNIRSIALAERLGAKPDLDATQPHPDIPCIVYRHPNLVRKAA